MKAVCNKIKWPYSGNRFVAKNILRQPAGSNAKNNDQLRSPKKSTLLVILFHKQAFIVQERRALRFAHFINDAVVADVCSRLQVV